jgi:ribosomal protein S12 methylthiotransferase accessory factor
MQNGVCHHDPGCLRAVIDWVDSRFGPLRNLVGFRLSHPNPAWWLYTCDLARAPIGMWYSPYPAGAAGTSTYPSEALQRALGEAVERYSALNAMDCVALASLTAGESPLLDRFPICAEEELCPSSFRRSLPPDLPISHASVQCLTDNEEILIPAAFVHLGFTPTPPEPMVTLPISTGLAFHSDLQMALWNGLCEVAERDAMMLMWWTRHPVPEIASEPVDLPYILADRVTRLRRVGLAVHFFDMTSDFRVPTVFCIVSGSQYPYWVTGASCRSDPIAACAKALDEAISVRVSVQNQRLFGDLSPYVARFDWVHSLEQHSLLYANWKSSLALDFLLHQEAAPLSFATFAEQTWWQAPRTMADLVEIGGQLQRMGLTVLWTELTAPEAIDIGHVVKVVVPEMLPLSQDHNARWLATPRLLQHAGLRWVATSFFNTFPHPFA